MKKMWGVKKFFIVFMFFVLTISVLLTACGGGGNGGGSSGGNSGGGGNSYSNATMSGTWIALDDLGDPSVYITADGNGVITDMGAFNMDNPPGSYNVLADGSVTVTLSGNNGAETFVCTGKFDSPTHGNFVCTKNNAPFGNFEVVKVIDIAACLGNWSGTLTQTSQQFTILFQIDATGTVTSFTGFTGPVTGKMYALTNGKAVGFFRTGETTSFNQIIIRGTLTGNSFTGIFGIDNGSPDNDGNVSLTR